MRISTILLGVTLGSFVGCSLPSGPVELDARNVAPTTDCSHLAAVLAKAVDSHGQVLPYALEKCADRLEEQLKILAVTGPTATPALLASSEDRLAYWYNASAAWSIKLAMLEKFPQDMGDAQLHDRSFPLDGRRMTLRQIQALLEQETDFRVALLVPCACVQSGLLPATPLTGADFRGRIDERFNRYAADPKRLVIDIDRREIRFGPELWRVRDRLIQEYRLRYGAPQATLATALLPYVHGAAQRRLQDAIGYRELPAQPTGLLALPEKFSFLKPW